jgi:hypothetical protein
MAITFNETEYLVSASMPLNQTPYSWTWLGRCPDQSFRSGNLYKNSDNRLFLVWQPLNSNYRAYCLLETKADILSGWG